jgi:putative tryptophan/tyrosine transport system substrate-binding protein
MKRRLFIAGLGAALIPLRARAQRSVPRIGVLLMTGPEPMGPFTEAMRDLGYIEGTNIHIEVRSAQGQPSRLPELAADLVRSNVDIIVASLTPAIMAAKQATTEIPIVMAPAGDPVATGLVESLSKPGGNITGLSSIASEAAAKGLEVIREFLPGAKQVGVVLNAKDPFSVPFLSQIRQGAEVTGFEVRQIDVHSESELESAYAEMARQRVDAVIMQGSLPVPKQVELALNTDCRH